ncbi:hypothetical protein [Caviibacter abscessus]|uniref:hypothetical protein n=1 Tax=Caviibacter abscessus TaxID=1766719 RepID=UPI0012E3695D|nr:hypothetical protein [Caviibacter abscessus]
MKREMTIIGVIMFIQGILLTVIPMYMENVLKNDVLVGIIATIIGLIIPILI